ncbi:MAG TPA: DUF5009 domain-containing protein [Candidatus Sumerlaeota bacterium]|nr:MAG: hypothetical protein BWY12_02088 [candidate division BRC1 bacterium ADurb.Bin183]HQH11126.1 DUF5009 domain-containing protein [Candidatus Sumerlaeota bacterium]HRR31455.1 DUF5009 domain-containing protein [Candidatus Sumerlaeia bacterium]
MNIKPQSEPNRSLGLDALRGVAIVGMILSGIIPWNTLPAWMYHIQTPPPSRAFDANVPGISWVDLVFPYFLFALGAAIPLALSRRLKKGTPLPRILFSIAERGFLLAFFGLFVVHIRPWSMMPDPDAAALLFGILGFALMFMIYTRMPETMPKIIQTLIRVIGYAGAIFFMMKLGNPKGETFTFRNRDIIIILLMVSAVVGSLAWLLTRENILMRLGFLGILMALRLSPHDAGWLKIVSEWNSSQAWLSWAFQIGFMQYLFIVIPGTIAGDMLVQWMSKKGRQPSEAPAWDAPHLSAIAAVMILLHLILLAGLYLRWDFGNMLLSAIILLLGWQMMKNPATEMERLMQTLYKWGAYWLILGLFFEPYEGGIKKDWATMSYFFVTSGMAIFLLIFFIITIDIFKWNKRLMGLLIDNGQNPMIAYVAMSNVIWPLLALTHLNKPIEAITKTPWLGAMRGAFYTFLMMLFVSFFTRRKIFWRS